MKFHNDKDAFQALLSVIAEKTGIREDIIEKDYYLTLLLSELASWQTELPAYFKGGTAMNTKRIAALVAKQDELTKMLGYKRREEQNRIGSDLAQKPFVGFLLFKALESDAKLQVTFAEMQRVYVFNNADIIPYTEVIKQMSQLYKVLQWLDS